MVHSIQKYEEGSTIEMSSRSMHGDKNRVLGIILAVAMVILGILLTIWPMSTGYAIMVVASIGFIVFGVFQIIAYMRTDRDYRNGWTLTNGIIYVVLGFLLLAETPAEMYMSYAFLLGFIALYTGITEFMGFGALRGGTGSGWLILSGVINIILAVFLFMTPFVATWAVEYVLGIYLIVGGVALFAEVSSGHYAVKL